MSGPIGFVKLCLTLFDTLGLLYWVGLGNIQPTQILLYWVQQAEHRLHREVAGMIGLDCNHNYQWVPLSKRGENARLILFYKIINNLAMVPHSCLEKADGRTRKKHNLKFRHIGYNVNPYGQSFFPKCISAWNGLAQEIAEANTLDLFKSKLAD